MIVYRLAVPGDGLFGYGIFVSGYVRQAYQETGCRRPWYGAETGHPDPHEDLRLSAWFLRRDPRSRGVPADCLFGFESLEQLFDWFDYAMRVSLSDKGAKLLVIEAPDAAVGIGTNQVCFIEAEARLVETLPIPLGNAMPAPYGGVRLEHPVQPLDRASEIA